MQALGNGAAGGRDSNYTIVVGGGRVGFYLARELMDIGYEVLVIENDEFGPRAAYIADQLGSAVVRGDGCEAAVLHEAGAAAPACRSPSPATTRTTWSPARWRKASFGVPKTIARLNDPRNEALFTAARHRRHRQRHRGDPGQD